MPNRRWTRDEDILVLDLYFKSGRRELPRNHPEVASLGEFIRRTPDAVSMRMGNVVYCDPDNPNYGLDGASAQTRDVWDEFARDEPILRKAASEIRRKRRNRKPLLNN